MTQPSLPPQPPPSWTYIFSRSYTLYRQRFWAFFRIALLPLLIANMFTQAWRVGIGELVRRGIVTFNFRRLSLKSLAVWLIFPFVQQGVYWLISTVFFAAVASNVLGREEDDPGGNSTLPADAYSTVRQRLGAIVTLGLITWPLMYFGRTALVLAILGLELRLKIHRLDPVFTAAAIVAPIVPAGLLLSRFALAIPALMEDPSISYEEAIRSSLERTVGWTGFVVIFLSKSAILGYMVYWLTDYAMEMLGQRWTLSDTLYSWTTWAIYLGLAAILESPLFIAFSVLHKELKNKREGALSAAVG